MNITKSTVVNRMQLLKLMGSLEFFIDHFDEMLKNNVPILEILDQLLLAEQNHVTNKKVFNLLKKSNIRYLNSHLMEIDYSNKVGLNKEVLSSFMDCQWIKSKHNLIFTGATGIGKTWLASAFGTHVCKQGLKVLFFDTTELFEEFETASRLGTISLLKKKLLSCQLLILDDFGLSKVRVDWMAHFISVIDKHTDHGSLLITSQYETKTWLNQFEDQTLGG